MAAREDQLQALVGKRRLIHLVLHCLRHLELPCLRVERAIAPDAVDRAVACGRLQPGARVVRDAVPRPSLGGDRERLLRGFLGAVEVAEEADQRGEHAAPLVAKDAFELRQCSTTGRTSIAPPRRAAGMRAPARARRRDRPASKRKKPPSVSFVSANGPSVVSVLPVLDADGRRGLAAGELLAADDRPPTPRSPRTRRRSRSSRPRRGSSHSVSFE